MKKQIPWEELTITNNFIFSKVLQQPHLCKKMIEILLNIKVEKIEYIQEEKSINLSIESKSVRLDVYVKGDDKIFNIEMQVANEQNLAFRVRYYQATIDLDNLEKGHNYLELPESYVIFICTFDPFGLGLPRYTFENKCKEASDLLLADGTYKIFFNVTACSSEENEDLKALLAYIAGNMPKHSFIEELSEAIESIKLNNVWRRDYMTLLMLEQEQFQKGIKIGQEKGIKIGQEKGIKIGQEKGIKIGELLEKQQIAKNMLSTLDNQSISSFTGLSLAEIEALRNQ